MVSFAEMEAWADGQPEVAAWLRRFSASTNRQYLRGFYLFFNHVKSQEGYRDATVATLIEDARREPFKMSRVVQDFISTIHGAETYRKKTYGAVISFFLHNRACICEPCLRMKSAEPSHTLSLKPAAATPPSAG